MASRYEREKDLGKGSFGEVILAVDKESRDDSGNFRKVAIKIIKNDKNGVERSGLREVRYLKSMKHANIIELLNIYSTDGALYLVMELAVNDLFHVIHSKHINLEESHIKRYMQMILEGVAFLHSKYILHRDLKPHNLMISSSGVLKIIDFGLSRSFGSPRRMSPGVMTSSYRPPEMVMGAEYYSTSADIWSVGCILAELILRKILFFGEFDDNVVGHLKYIFSIFGTPNEADWPDAHLLPAYHHFEARTPLDLTAIFDPDLFETRRQPQSSSSLSISSSSGSGGGGGSSSFAISYDGDDRCAHVDLFDRMMKLNPRNRISASDALKHKYFALYPFPSSIEDLPSTPKKDPSRVP